MDGNGIRGIIFVVDSSSYAKAVCPVHRDKYDEINKTAIRNKQDSHGKEALVELPPSDD